MDNIKNLTVNLDAVDMHDHGYVVEASDLGLRPGCFPVTVTVSGTTFTNRKVATTPEGDLSHVEYYAYVQGYKRTLAIVND